MASILGIDVGGTFTDFVYYEPGLETLKVWKTLSTPGDPSVGIIRGIEAGQLSAIDYLRLGTTIATNAILERKGATVAFVTTSGFKDVPFIQRGKRQSHYDINWIKSKPLVKRRHCFEIKERITPREGVYIPLDEEQARGVAKSIAKLSEIDSIAICLLCSYVIPDHERRLREIFQEEIPSKPLSISYDILPKWKEHERSSTTIADAYIKPLVADNLKRLKEQLSKKANVNRTSIIKSNGGEVSIDNASANPIHLSLSGPTGGVIGARYLANQLLIDNIVTLDMGGTSTDVSTIVSGKESFTTTYEIEFGVPIQIPMIDIRTMGAGGGSIAWIDKGGMLRVGPESAGAEPGPACYDKGGRLPTVTDANVVLGRINPDYFLGGQMQLNGDVAYSSVAGLAKELKTSVDNAAMGILQIANNNMVGAMRLVLTEKGLDPRDFTLLAFGGAGPVHVTDLMELGNLASAVVPNYPGQFSAFGFTITDARIDLERTVPMTSKTFDAVYANQVMRELTEEAERAIELQGYEGQVALVSTLEMRYFGQNHELEIPFPDDVFNESSIPAVWTRFHKTHKDRYNFEIIGETIELISIKVTAVCQTPNPELPRLDRSNGKAEPCETRLVYFNNEKIEAQIFKRSHLTCGHKISGPALVEEEASVTVISPGINAMVDDFGNLLIGEIAESYELGGR